MQFRKNGFSYEWLHIERHPRQNLFAGPGTTGHEDEWYETTITANRVDVTFVGGHPQPVLIATKPAAVKLHFYTPPAGVDRPIQASVWQQLIYKNIYPGIDLIFDYDDQDSISPIRYSCYVRSGADAGLIRLKYSGATHISLDEVGACTISNHVGWVKETAPRAFRVRDLQPVDVARCRVGDVTSFKLATTSDDVLIDPNLLWGTLYGGSQSESIGEVATDKQDKLIIAGSTASSTNIATSGAHQVTYKGNDDMYLAKFKSVGKMEWATYFGGTNDEIGYGTTTDKNNNVILLGKSQSGNQITTPGAYQTQGGGLGDICIAKFNKDGVLSWCTLLGKFSSEHVRTAVCDDKANIYACGYTGSDSLKISNKNSSYYEGNGDAFVVKFSPNGWPSWSAYVGGPGQDRAHSIALDQSGNVYVVGTTESTSGFSTPGAHQVAHGGIEDAFVAKLDSTGNQLWVTYYGGTGDDHGRGVFCNKKAHIYVCGYTNSAGVFGTAGSYQKNINSKKLPNGSYTYDGFVAKFSYNGQRIWGSYYGGGRDDQLTGIDWDGNRNIYVSGTASSNDSISTPSAFQKHRYGNTNEGCFAVFDSLQGTLTYGSYLGGLGDDRMEDITAGPDQLIYMVGTSTASIYSRPDVWQPTYSGNTDAWLMRFNIATNCRDEFEPNESSSTAYSLTATTDTTIYGYTAAIATGADQDWYKIKTSAPHTNLKIRLTDMTKNYTMTLYNSSGTVLATSYADAAGGQTLVYNHNKKKTYYLLINHDASTFDSVTCYRLRAWVKNTPYFSDESMRTFLIHTAEGQWQMKLAPNPTREFLQVSYDVPRQTECVLRLISSSGQVVAIHRTQLQPGSHNFLWHLPSMASGIYLLDCRTAEWQHQERVVIY
ncbi:MAG: SBBP repeat-containing protein [Chitinophagales bacterium]|nr:SBBP repeat-containing protein [Chitinophagales bacterium]MDW8427389.1 SBBP repeat-containing protein [Chitinophagales bacterium]